MLLFMYCDGLDLEITPFADQVLVRKIIQCQIYVCLEFRFIGLYR